MNGWSRAAALAAGATLWGCTIGNANSSNSSHFAFPNSNVIPLGETEGSVGKLCGILFVNWGSPNADDQEAAIREALRRSNGDMLINMRTETKMFMVPNLFATCSTRVRGVAAKMEIGRQELTSMSPKRTGGCNSNADCKAGRACEAGECVAPDSAPAPPAAPAAVSGGCRTNGDCKVGRICKNGECASP